VPKTMTPIQPVVLGDAVSTMRLSIGLENLGFRVPGIRPPTVPQGTSRLRVTLSAAHEDSDVDQLLDAMRRLT
ncbi:MAG: 8-amino-7-oxononanoate synthase, partial [Burkholderiales bacterium]